MASKLKACLCPMPDEKKRFYLFQNKKVMFMT